MTNDDIAKKHITVITIVYVFTSPNVDRISQLICCHTKQEFRSKTVVKDITTLKCVATLPCKN